MRTYSQSNIEFLEELSMSGAFDILVMRSMLGTNIKVYVEMYYVTKKQIEHGIKKMQAYQNTAEAFGYSETTVRDVIRWCEARKEG